MLKSVSIDNIGPLSKVKLCFHEGANVLYGATGVGKSLTLNSIWRGLTGEWPQDCNESLLTGYTARPKDLEASASIRLGICKGKGTSAKTGSYACVYDFYEDPRWRNTPSRKRKKHPPYIATYALSDGSFAVWDAVKQRVPESQALALSSRCLWNGLRKLAVSGQVRIPCEGALADIASWIQDDPRLEGSNSDVARMSGLLQCLAPCIGLKQLALSPELTRLSVNDCRSFFSVVTDNQEKTPIIYASSRVRQIVALSYMLCWTWREHQRAAKDLNSDVYYDWIVLLDQGEGDSNALQAEALHKTLSSDKFVSNEGKRMSAQIIVTHAQPEQPLRAH